MLCYEKQGRDITSDNQKIYKAFFLIQLFGVSVFFGSVTALKNISLSINKGDLIAIVGPNGGGKSTFLKILSGHLLPSKGSIKNSCPNIAYLPQYPDLDRTFPFLVKDVVAMGGWPLSPSLETIQKALEEVGLENMIDRPLSSLSGGQWQRVLFARLFLQKAECLLLDEPFSAVDQETQHKLMHLILKWHQEGKTILVALHDFQLVKHYFPKVLLLAHQVEKFASPQDVLTTKTLVKAAYDI
ncbi:MAG: metal ABC transporter ATP-binding protein [Proteobacteria bacterium]|nr:metal ABC transporter ATP-binding protein [Pseudomonadota bacterium]